MSGSLILKLFLCKFSHVSVSYYYLLVLNDSLLTASDIFFTETGQVNVNIGQKFGSSLKAIVIYNQKKTY